MRLLYTSPRQQNIDRVTAFLGEHGVETTVTNRSNYRRPTYQRFSYSQRNENQDNWPQVWVTRADDFTRARELLGELGIDPAVRFAAELHAQRNPTAPETLWSRRDHTVKRVRRIVLLAILGVFAVLMLHYLHLI